MKLGRLPLFQVRKWGSGSYILEIWVDKEETGCSVKFVIEDLGAPWGVIEMR